MSLNTNYLYNKNKYKSKFKITKKLKKFIFCKKTDNLFHKINSKIKEFKLKNYKEKSFNYNIYYRYPIIKKPLKGFFKRIFYPKKSSFFIIFKSIYFWHYFYIFLKRSTMFILINCTFLVLYKDNNKLIVYINQDNNKLIVYINQDNNKLIIYINKKFYLITAYISDNILYYLDLFYKNLRIIKQNFLASYNVKIPLNVLRHSKNPINDILESARIFILNENGLSINIGVVCNKESHSLLQTSFSIDLLLGTIFKNILLFKNRSKEAIKYAENRYFTIFSNMDEEGSYYGLNITHFQIIVTKLIDK